MMYDMVCESVLSLIFYGPDVCSLLIGTIEGRTKYRTYVSVTEYRCYERLKVKTEGITRLTYTGLHGELEVKRREV